jgi:hypothetical protein
MRRKYAKLSIGADVYVAANHMYIRARRSIIRHDNVDFRRIINYASIILLPNPNCSSNIPSSLFHCQAKFQYPLDLILLCMYPSSPDLDMDRVAIGSAIAANYTSKGYISRSIFDLSICIQQNGGLEQLNMTN